jgi:hypothetical protein
MRLITARIPYQSGDTFTLWPLGDLHYGSSNCAVKLLDDVIEEIRSDSRAFWIGMGDMIEAIAPDDPRWRAATVDRDAIQLEKQDAIGDHYVDVISKKLSPIADKCLAYGDGNHEEVFKHKYTHLSVRVLERLGRPECYSGWAGMTRLAFEDTNNHRTSIRVFHQHGWQAGRQDGAKVNESRRLMAYIDADIYLTGHSHSKFIIPNTRLVVNPSWTHIDTETCYVAHTGSFLRTLQQDKVGYAERAGYPPTTIGPPRFTIQVFTDHTKIEGIL